MLTGNPRFQEQAEDRGSLIHTVTTGHGHWCRGWNWASVQCSWEHRTKAKIVFSSSLLPAGGQNPECAHPRILSYLNYMGPVKEGRASLKFPYFSSSNTIIFSKPSQLFLTIYSKSAVSSCIHTWMGLCTSFELHGNEQTVVQRNEEIC